MFRCVSVCEYVSVSADVLGGQEMVLDPMELVVSHPAWVLGIKLVLCKSSMCSSLPNDSAARRTLFNEVCVSAMRQRLAQQRC